MFNSQKFSISETFINNNDSTLTIDNTLKVYFILLRSYNLTMPRIQEERLKLLQNDSEATSRHQPADDSYDVKSISQVKRATALTLKKRINTRGKFSNIPPDFRREEEKI